MWYSGCMETQTAAFKIYTAMQETMTYLYSRWQDERAYEDFDQYATVAKNALQKADESAVFVAMKRRPFSVTFDVDGKTYIIWVTATAYQYKRVK